MNYGNLSTLNIANKLNLMKNTITHLVLGINPFTVKFTDSVDGSSVIEKYAFPLTNKQIREEYSTIIFPRDLHRISLASN